MKYFVVPFVLIVASLFVVMAAQQAVRQRPGVSVQGRVVVRQSAELRRFSQPVVTPPATVPPVRPGHRWHWHRHYGWIALPETLVVPGVQGVLLPENYALPQQVPVYEAPTQGCSVVCPHCGHALSIQVQ